MNRKLKILAVILAVVIVILVIVLVMLIIGKTGKKTAEAEPLRSGYFTTAELSSTKQSEWSFDEYSDNQSN